MLLCVSVLRAVHGRPEPDLVSAGQQEEQKSRVCVLRAVWRARVAGRVREAACGARCRVGKRRGMS